MCPVAPVLRFSPPAEGASPPPARASLERVEVEIAAMEAQEREHIARLQELQVDQKAAYEELERALAS